MTRRRVGDPKPRGRLDRDLGPFRLRPGLSSPGGMPFDDALALVFTDWQRQVTAGNIAAETPEQYETYLRGLRVLALRQGMTEVADLTVNFLLMWCLMPLANGGAVTDGVRRARRAAARSFFETAKVLGITDVNPAKSIEFPSRTDRYVNALTDDQIRHLQQHSRMSVNDLRTPTAMALVMSGATTREIGFVTVADVDLPNRRVWVHDGGYRQRDRWIVLCDDWCILAVTRLLEDLRATHDGHADDQGLVYRPRSSDPSPARQKDAGGMMILRLLKFARVHRPGITRAGRLQLDRGRARRPVPSACPPVHP
jgi:site-specific recombinase XerD